MATATRWLRSPGLLQHGEHLTRQCEHWSSVTEVDMEAQWLHEREKRSRETRYMHFHSQRVCRAARVSEL